LKGKEEEEEVNLENRVEKCTQKDTHIPRQECKVSVNFEEDFERKTG